MPRPKRRESQQHYVSRCIRQSRHEGYSQKQAQGRCYGMYRYYRKKKK